MPSDYTNLLSRLSGPLPVQREHVGNDWVISLDEDAIGEERAECTAAIRELVAARNSSTQDSYRIARYRAASHVLRDIAAGITDDGREIARRAIHATGSEKPHFWLVMLDVANAIDAVAAGEAETEESAP